MDIKKPKRSKASKSAFGRKSKKATKALTKRAKGYISGEDKLVETNPNRVTNDTMNKHRKEVLEDARKFKYPLQHSKYRIAIISVAIVFISLLLFGTFSYSLLYKQQNIGDFAYRISKIVPMPVARVDGTWVSFEKYLFEVRQNAHYLINQEEVDFDTPEGQEAMRKLKEQSLIKVQDDEIVRQLAAENGVTVSNEEVDAQIGKIREAGGIGDDSQTLEDTLRDFYGWDLDDLKRVVEGQLLKQKIVFSLDTEARDQINAAYTSIQDGEKTFDAAVIAFSEDELTKDKKGLIGTVSRDNESLPRELVDTAFGLAEGEVSGVIQTPFGLHIVKRVKDVDENQIKVAHILVKWEDPQKFIDQRREQIEVSSFISF